MRTALTLAAMISLAAGTAFAQSISPNETSQDAANRGQGIVQPKTGGASTRAPDLNPSGSPRTNLPDWTGQNGNHSDERAAPVTARTGRPVPAAAVVPAGPAPLNAHQAACAARYRTYDPASDMFYARPGVKQRCRIASPGALY